MTRPTHEGGLSQTPVKKVTQSLDPRIDDQLIKANLHKAEINTLLTLLEYQGDRVYCRYGLFWRKTITQSQKLTELIDERNSGKNDTNRYQIPFILVGALGLFFVYLLQPILILET